MTTPFSPERTTSTASIRTPTVIRREQVAVDALVATSITPASLAAPRWQRRCRLSQGHIGKSGGPVQNYELGPSAVAAAC